MKTMYIGGVPEHFNLPWYITLRDKAYAPLSINLRWKDFPGGTGAMCEALRNKEIDMAVILTEGIIRDIIHGNPSVIVQQYVGSSLQWGIHTAKDAPFTDLISLKGSRAAISRYGSGSHLMAYVNAMELNWDLNTDLQFELINSLDGALQALPGGTADYFMWEKYTTQPFVDQGIFKRIGVCPTPWPCFVIAVRKEVWQDQRSEVEGILKVINSCTEGFKAMPGIDQMISIRYQQQVEDVRRWLDETAWSSSQLSLEMVVKVQEVLLQAGLIDRRLAAEHFLSK
ncbi:substrate-binding domain-containing protein [Aureitalea marina]|uniref:ABC transporter substrate-binding protein n=1 Tax=Aureitalea marina TaxID=930804 RepID=A0A2S7KTT8_9FLAO|nr:substrate-binding domain-containing protein [Aureitalea marina]PQB05968.1 ABC transporter substrate-binding protein [Aureitalea marina]